MIVSGKLQNGDITRAYSVSCYSKTPDANMRSPYGDTLLLEFEWLITCVLRNHNMASNTKLTTVRDHELVKFTSSFRSKLSSKGTCQKYFTTVRGCFGLGTGRVKALGEWKKKEEEDEDDESRFSPFPGSSL